MRLDRELACRDIVELVTAYLEHALPPGDRERFEEHLVFCDGCGTYLEQMRTTIAATGRLEPAALESGGCCARRTRQRAGYVPVPAGFVAAVGRSVAADRIPIAGFAAARAAELRDGPAAYEEERLAQATWLAERLGLDGDRG